MLWMALHFPRLSLEIFLAGQPKTSQAWVVLENNRVLEQNLAAQNCGIRLGSTLATAYSIHPQLQHRHRAIESELEQLNILAEMLYRFSGQVSIQAPDCVLLEIGGSLKLFLGKPQLIHEAQTLCLSLGYTCSIGVAKTPWAAIALARSQEMTLNDVPLARAGLELTGVNANTVERFSNMGIYTLGAVLALPRKALGRRFGKSLQRYLAQLVGTQPDPREIITPKPNFVQCLHLLAPITNKNVLYQHSHSPMCHLSQALEHWLVTHQLGCHQLCWQFLSHNHEQVEILVPFATGRQNAADIIRLSKLKLEQPALPDEIMSICLRAEHVQPWEGSSQSLFKLMGTSEAEHPLGDLIDEFNARLGDQCCQNIQALPQHIPELTWRKQSVEIPTKNKASAYVEPRYAKQLSMRPLWLFNPPREIQKDELEFLQGPERIQSHWFNGSEICRDYFIAQHQLGAQCWVFVDQKSRWYLHGYFG